VTPAGFEPAIFWMRTRYPGPLDEGATYVYSCRWQEMPVKYKPEYLTISVNACLKPV
jgi:hypothetical protein